MAAELSRWPGSRGCKILDRQVEAGPGQFWTLTSVAAEDQGILEVGCRLVELIHRPGRELTLVDSVSRGGPTSKGPSLAEQ